MSRFLIKTGDLYWKPDGRGYTSCVLAAGVYDEEKAIRIERLRQHQDTAVPLKDAIAELTKSMNLEVFGALATAVRSGR